MTLQGILFGGVISISALIALVNITNRHYGYAKRLLTQAWVIVCSFVAAQIDEGWAGWVALAIFLLLVIVPFTLRVRTYKMITQASKLPNLNDTMRVLSKMEASGSTYQRGLAKLQLAYEACQWNDLLALSRANIAPPEKAKSMEIRALLGLGRLNELVATYSSAARRLPPLSKTHAQIIILAIAGKVNEVKERVGSSAAKTDYDAQTFWVALARLRNEIGDKYGREMMKTLSETAIQERMRSLALSYLRNVEVNRSAESEPLTAESMLCVERIIHDPGDERRRDEAFARRVYWGKRIILAFAFIYIVFAIVRAIADRGYGL